MFQLGIAGLILIVVFINSLIGLISPRQSALYCGLTGFSGKTPFDMMKLKFLLYWNYIERGKDATGVFTPKNGTKKSILRAEDFIKREEFTSLEPDTLFISHVRAKTIGINSVENAHPFNYGPITLAHNGTLQNHWSLATKYGLSYKDFNVDSQILAACVAKNLENSNNATDLKVLSEYEGAAAVLAYNDEQDIMYAFHDNQRPLYYGKSDGNMYISSIKASLEVLGCIDVTEFPVNILHIIKSGEIIATKKFTHFADVVDATTKFRVVSARKDIVERATAEGTKVFLPRNTSGLTYAVCETDYVVGYWLRKSTIYTNGFINGRQVDGSEFTKDNWYKIVGVDPNSRYLVKVVNDHGETVTESLSTFDTQYFIPTKNSYVVIMKDLYYPNTDSPAARVGDIYKVRTYIYNEPKIYIEDAFNPGVSFNCPIGSVRCATKTEISEVLLKLAAPEKDDTIIDFSTISTESPFSDAKDLENVQDDTDETTYIDVDDHLNVLEAIDNVYKSLVVHNNKNENINEDLDELNNILQEAYICVTTSCGKC